MLTSRRCGNPWRVMGGLRSDFPHFSTHLGDGRVPVRSTGARWLPIAAPRQRLGAPRAR